MVCRSPAKVTMNNVLLKDSTMAVKKPIIFVRNSEEDLAEKLCRTIEQLANTTIEHEGSFKIGVSGGSLVKLLSLKLQTVNTDWSKWSIFFCDECVYFDSTVKTLYEVYTELIRSLKIPIPLNNIVQFNLNAPASEAAKNYISKLALHFPPDCIPRFDCLLLGIGSDGHICSLFPSHAVLNETSVWVTSITDSPKPPISRVTFTFPVINNSETCIFTASGSEKADIIKRVFDGEDLPATKVNQECKNVIWILDKTAAKKLDANRYS